MRYLTLSEVFDLHDRIIRLTGGSFGIRDLKVVESALAQPRMTFGGSELYLSIIDKAATIGFLLIRNHPFIDGNKRTGHAAMETFLVLNGFEISASVDEQEKIILSVVSGTMARSDFVEWLQTHVAKTTVS